MKTIYETLANCHPDIQKGIVWCRKCGKEKRIDPVNETMTIDHPSKWKK